MKYFAPLLVILALALPALAQDHGHTHEGAVGKFYKTWTMPDNRAVSCCHDEDCGPAQSKMVDGSWYARFTDDDEWTKIPVNKIETDRDSPDGRSHLCGRKFTYWGAPNFTVYCFLPAGGS